MFGCVCAIICIQTCVDRFSFSHISSPCPCAWYVGQRVLHKPLHLSLPLVHSSFIFQAFKSLLTVSFHFNLGPPLGHFPSIFILATHRVFSLSEDCRLLVCLICNLTHDGNIRYFVSADFGLAKQKQKDSSQMTSVVGTILYSW